MRHQAGRPGTVVPGGAHALSPYTGWTRQTWAELADRMLAAVTPYTSPGGARITPPGPAGGYGSAVDGLEGFARTFLLAGFRLAGEGGADPHGLAERYAAGIAAGTDPGSPERWVRLDEHPQAKVEAASIALILDLTRPWIWDRLDTGTQERVVDYLAPAVGDDTYPRINWVWFRLVVQTFLRSVAGPHSPEEMAEDLATHDTFVRTGGWLADGPQRAYDHYAGWALHLYPTLWARMAGAESFATARREGDAALLDEFLRDAVHLVGADGSPLVQGRSLTYRFAAAAPFWAGALAGVPSTSPGLLRRAASGVVQHFVTRGAPDARGLLTLGWHHPWPRLAQSYSGPASPYWASKGLLGLALPADHPVWTDPEEPLPVEQGTVLRAVRAPGWIVAGAPDDGIVRVVNHGTDHAEPGAGTGDSPLYARLGYSTATSPLLDDDAWTEPLEQSVALIDADGRATHRTGMRLVDLAVADDDGAPVGLAASVAQAHWLTPAGSQEHHGSGYTGAALPAGEITTVSLVHASWELRLARVDTLTPAGQDAVALRLGGWAVAGPGVRTQTGAGAASATAGGRTSSIAAAIGAAGATVERRADASPLGDPALVPALTFPVPAGAWVAAFIELSDGTAPPEQVPSSTAVLVEDDQDAVVHVTWPDRARTSTRLTRLPGAPPVTAPDNPQAQGGAFNPKEQE